jgi:hypothetical protein
LNGAHTVSSTVTARGCSVRCVKIEEAPVPELEILPATSVELDGEFEDWEEADEVEDPNSIKMWKFGYDSDNLYFYYKIKRSKIIAAKAESPEGSGQYPFDSRRYIYIGLDTDNNASTGDVPDYGDMTIPGCEVLCLVFPFRGYASSASGTDGLEIVNGLDENSWTRIPAASGSRTGSQITAYGVVEDDFVYLEIGIPKAGLGENTTGKMKVQFSLSSDLSAETVIKVQ